MTPSLKLRKESAMLCVILVITVLQLCLAPLGRPLIIALQALALLVLLVMALKGRKSYVSTVLILIWIAISVFNYYNLDMAVSPDAVKYRGYFFNYKSDPSYYISEIYQEIKQSRYYDVSSYSVVGVIFYPLADALDWAGIDDAFLVLNFLFAVLTFLFYNKSIDHLSTNFSNEKKAAFLIWVFLPVVVYHYQVFSKDILSAFLCATAVLFLAKRQYVSAVLVFALATMLRPYSVAIIFAMYYFISDNARFLIYGAICSLIIVTVFVGVSGIVNSVLVLLYMPISPNFFSLDIERKDYIPLYVESFIFFIGILLFLVSVCYSRLARAFSYQSFAALFVYSCVMTVLGKYSAEHYDMTYEVGTMGNNALRKKIPILQIYISMVFVGLSFFKYKKKI